MGAKLLRAAQWAAHRHASHSTGAFWLRSVALVLGLATLVLEDGVRCPAPSDEHLGHLEEPASVLARRRPHTPITEELRATLADIERLAELETATPAWRVTRTDAA